VSSLNLKTTSLPKKSNFIQKKPSFQQSEAKLVDCSPLQDPSQQALFVQHSSGHHRQLTALCATTDERTLFMMSLLDRGVY
jgi:hypothetical protein